MIKSMTGFGRCEISQKDRKIVVEMKAVNHRYLDVNIKIPKKLSFFESAVRNVLKKFIQRGKVDVFVTCEDETGNQIALKYNEDIAAEYLKYFRKMASHFGLEDDIKVSTLSAYPEVLSMEERTADEEEIWKMLETAVTGACNQFVLSRIAEGDNLLKDLLLKLDGMQEHLRFIEKRSPEIISEYRKRLEDKVKDLLGDTQLEEGRLATEIVLLADKISVDEEVVRLGSHIEQTRLSLLEGGGVGRKLDFIAQEMNREANTILSKANDLEVSNEAINLKTEIEKIREQIQNIE